MATTCSSSSLRFLAHCRSAVALLATVTACTGACGCHDAAPTNPATPVDDSLRRRMSIETEARLRTFGKDIFTVVEIRSTGERHIDLRDDFQSHNRLCFSEFTARLHYDGALRTLTRGELRERMGAPTSGIADTERALQIFDVFGEQPRSAGTDESIDAAGVFVDLEPGFRFERLDARRGPLDESPQPGQSGR